MKPEESWCFFCGEPADILCDGVLGYLKHQNAAVIDMGSPNLPIFTCDRPICGKCVSERNPIHMSAGKKSGWISRDFCSDCVNEGRQHGQRIHNGEQRKAELFTLEEGRALQKRRLFRPAPVPTALDRAKARIIELEIENDILRKADALDERA